MAEKMRVHILAKELNVPSKTIIEKCKAEGVTTVKNHMSTLSAGLHATILEWFSESMLDTAVETAERVNLERVRIRRKRKKKAVTEKDEEAAVAVAETTVEAPTGTPVDVTEAPATPETPTYIEEPAVATVESLPAEPIVVAEVPIAVAEAPAAELVEKTAPFLEEPAEAAVVPAAESPKLEAAVVAEPAEALPADEAEIALAEPILDKPEPPVEEPELIKPAGPQNVPAKAKLQGPRVVRYEAPDYEAASTRQGPAGPRRGGPGAPTGVQPVGPKEVGMPTDRGSGRRKSRVSPRRAAGRLADTGGQTAGWGDRDLAERRERLAGATGRRIRRRTHTGAAAQPVTTGPKTEATVHEPVRMKEFCSGTGLNFMQCFKVLKDEHGILANVNMALPTDTAELLALHFGIELKIIPSKTRLDALREEFAARESRNQLPRPPVVTMLGHVDHGKTSLLDAIRETRVVAGEDGGITQHIGAYHLGTDAGSVTFLDTPGHEAFTAIRARGARLTDVVVLVIAADDGVMPQTIEAINHAKAAEVPIVVALNKIDLGDQNKLKIYGQLTEHGLTPSGEWGGDVDVIPTSATTGTGIDKLVGHLAELTTLLELRADPTLPATGAVIEAETKPGVGAVVRLLVQEGTLHVGDFVVCGPACGKVRALLNDHGERIREAGPSLPVEVWGLDDVPMAGDMLYSAENMQRAKEIATETKQTRIERARVQSRKVFTLEEMFQQRDSDEIPELNIIVKADVDGSVAALAQALNEIPSEEVRLTVRHSGVGAVNDSDVLLAAACRGIVVAFRVDAAVAVRRLAEQHGVDVRAYRVIYDVCDDIKKALEGLLAPEERVEPRASAEVRQLFRLSRKAGMIAGSYVTHGTIDRSHLAKVIRDGVVVREGCKLGSLRRFKDDVKEVRAGFECGIRLEGFDDVHVGDLIETYEIVKVARTL